MASRNRSARHVLVFAAATLVLMPSAGAIAGAGGNPRQPHSLSTATDDLVAARTALARGDVPRAVSIADARLRRDPRDREAVAIKVEALASARDWESALDAYDAFTRAGGSHDAELLKQVSRGVLLEAVAFFPALRVSALARLACSGDRDALVQVRRRGEVTDLDVEGLAWKARLGDVESLFRLREVALTGLPNFRAAALQALQQLRDRGAERAIVASLGDTDPFVRLTAARAARSLRMSPAEAALRKLLSDPNALIAVEAASALATLGATDVLDRLRPLATSPSPELRFHALAGLIAIEPAPERIAALAAIARAHTPAVWDQAAELLAAHDPEAAATAVRTAIADPNPSVRLQALRLLPRVSASTEEDLPALRNALRDLNTLVRIEAATVMLGAATMCP